MRGGIWVLNIFGAIWGVAGIIVGYQPVWLALLPLAISAAIMVWAGRRLLPPGNAAGGAHIGRLIAFWSAAEGVAMFITANVLINLHMPTAIMPAVAIIVGLHFFPLARGIPVRLYYKTGAALIVVAVAALLLPPDDRALATGMASALVMWLSAILLARQGRG